MALALGSLGHPHVGEAESRGDRWSRLAVNKKVVQCCNQFRRSTGSYYMGASALFV